MLKKKGILHEIVVFLKGFIVAFSMYSKLPMPQLAWQEENMKYAICAFPCVGVVIGAVSYGWFLLCGRFQGIPELTRICFAALIPVIITGGIHIDGFMDTSDALHSYQPKEKKLEILKDSHIGAFAVIMLFLYAVAGLGAYAMLHDRTQILMLGGCFILSRILSGIAVVSFPNARKEGTLYTFSSNAHKKAVRILLLLELLLCTGVMLFWDIWMGSIVICGALLTFAFYYVRSKKEFGGITGDLAGWFVCICELVTCILVGVLG